jgi:hypothetical protein
MTRILRRVLRRGRLVDPRRLCAAGLHADRVYVRVHVFECGDLGTCPGHHAGLRCPVCGATWDVTTGALVRAEALS